MSNSYSLNLTLKQQQKKKCLSPEEKIQVFQILLWGHFELPAVESTEYPEILVCPYDYFQTDEVGRYELYSSNF